MNKLYLIGNVVHTPEMRTTGSGAEVCNFSIAVKRRFKNPQTGEYGTDFFDIQAWHQLASLCATYIEKGKKVAVIGRIQSREYEGRDGTKKRVWEVVADEVEFLSPKSDAPAQTAAPVAQHPMTREEARATAKVAAALASPTQGFIADDDEPLPF